MRWILETLKTLAGEGVMLGNKSKEKYLVDRLLENNGLETASMELYYVRVDTGKKRCSHFSNIRCKISEAAQSQKVEIFDFVLEGDYALVSYAKNVLGYERRAVQLLSPFPVDENAESTYCCDRCYYKYKLETVVDRLNYASLDIAMSFGAAESESTLIGLKRKMEKKEAGGQPKEEEAQCKRMVALAIRYGGQVYLISKKDKISLLRIEEHVLEGGVGSRNVFLIKEIIASAEDLARITENDAYQISYVDVDRIYRFDGATGQTVNIVAGNADKFKKEYEAAYPDDTMFSDIRSEAKRVAKNDKPPLSADILEKINKALANDVKSIESSEAGPKPGKEESGGAPSTGGKKPAEEPAPMRPGIVHMLTACLIVIAVVYFTARWIMSKHPPQMRRVPVL